MIRKLLVAGFFVAALGFAQDEGGGFGGGGGGGGGGGRGGGGGGGGMGGGGGAPRVQRKSKIEMFVDKLKLNKEQTDEFLKIHAAGREEAQPLLEGIDKERANIANAVLNNKPDAQKKAVDDLAVLRAKMVAIEAKAFGRVVATLKEKDRAKAAPAFEYLAGAFDVTPMAGGRGGRGMRGGGPR